MTEEQYKRERNLLEQERRVTEREAEIQQSYYRNALRMVDAVKDQIRQLDQAWINQQEGETHG